MNVKPFAAIVAVSILASPIGRAGEGGTPTSAGASAGGSSTMRITRSGTQPSQKGPAEHFTGSVQLDGKVVEWMEKVTDEQYAR